MANGGSESDEFVESFFLGSAIQVGLSNGDQSGDFVFGKGRGSVSEILAFEEFSVRVELFFDRGVWGAGDPARV